MPPGNGDGVGKRLRDCRAPQKARHDGAVAPVALHQLRADADIARFACRFAVQPCRTDDVHRLKRYAAAVPALQKSENVFAVILRIDDYIADVRSERRFHGERVPVLGADHFADRTVNAAQRPALGLLHDDLCRLAEAFQLFFQFGEEMQTRIARAKLHRELCLPFRRLRRLLLASRHEHGVTGNHVGKALLFFLYLVQPLLFFDEPCRRFLVLLLGSDKLFLRLRGAAFHRLAILGKKRNCRAVFCERSVKLIFPGEHDIEPLILFVHSGGVFRFAGAKLLKPGGQSAAFGGNVRDAGLMLADLPGKASGAFALLTDLALQALQGLFAVGDLRAHNGGAAFRLRCGVFRRAERFTQLLGADVHIAHPGGKAFAFGVQPVLLGASRRAFHDRFFIVRAQQLRLLMKPVKVRHPERYLLLAQLVAQYEIFLRRFRLLAQRFDLHFQLRDLVADSQEVVLRAGELALRFILAVAEAGDACRFFKYLAPVGRLGGNDLADTSLPDDRIPVAAETGVHQKLRNIAQTHQLAVDIVLALAAAVAAAGDAHLVGVQRENARRVVQHKRHLRKAHCAALFCAAENDVLHFSAAQHPRFLLAHDPQKRVRQIGLSAAVGSDDHRYILFKAQPRLFGKRLEALEFQRF